LGAGLPVERIVMFKRIDHVEIVTDQLDRTVQFYTEVLGFTVKSRDRIGQSGSGVPIELVTWTSAARSSN
jgi:4-hydroxyphenylpyruvate dioxygenase-like putative hemolysin